MHFFCHCETCSEHSHVYLPSAPPLFFLPTYWGAHLSLNLKNVLQLFLWTLFCAFLYYSVANWALQKSIRANVQRNLLDGSMKFLRIWKANQCFQSLSTKIKGQCSNFHVGSDLSPFCLLIACLQKWADHTKKIVNSWAAWHDAAKVARDIITKYL